MNNLFPSTSSPHVFLHGQNRNVSQQLLPLHTTTRELLSRLSDRRLQLVHYTAVNWTLYSRGWCCLLRRPGLTVLDGTILLIPCMLADCPCCAG